MHDTVTILTTIGDNASATKLVRVDDDGTIIKVPFSAGKFLPTDWKMFIASIRSES